MTRDPGAIFCLACCLLLCAPGSLFAQTPQGALSSCPGDVTLDGVRGPGDLSVLSAHLSGSRPLEGQALENADANLDLVVDVGDLTRLLGHTSGKRPLLPCGGFSLVEVACPQVVFEEASAIPLESVGIGILPEEFQQVAVAFVLTEDQQFSVITLVERLEDDSAVLFVPFHPGGSTVGGAVTVQVTDGRVRCSPRDFTIEAIPENPGELTRVLDAVQETIRRAAEPLGLTPEDLVDPEAELSPVALPLVLAQRVLDDPDDPENSLRAMSSGAFLGADLDVESLDAFVGHLRVRDLIEGNFSSAPGLAGSPTVPNETPSGGLNTPSQLSVFDCNESPLALSDCMSVASSARSGELFGREPGQGQAAGKVLEDLNKSVNVGSTLAGYGLVNTGVRQLAGKVTSELGICLAMDVMRWSQEALAALLPSTLTRLELQLMPPILEEDRENGFEEIKLFAASQGWKLDARRIFEEVADDNAPLAPDLEDTLESTPAVLARELLEAGVLPGGLSIPPETSTKEIKKKLIDFAVEKQEEYLPFFSTPVVEIEPDSFGPVLLVGPNWKENDLKGSAVQFTGEGSNVYEPVEVGKAEIIARVRTDGGRFGGAASISTSAPVEVEQIVVRVSPEKEVVTKAGQKKTFEATVENSFFPQQVEVEAVDGSTSVTYDGGNKHTITYEAPSLEALPDVLTVTHTANTGARRFSGQPRLAQATISRAEVIVTPNGICIEPGSTQQFSAEVTGLNNGAVSWAASAGEISNSGFFRAPEVAATVSITATSLADSELKGEAAVKVGGCDCWWFLVLDGVTAGQPGDSAGFVIDGNSLTLINLTQGFQFSSFLPLLSSVPIGQPGIFDVTVQGNLGVGPSENYLSTSEMASPKLTLIENTSMVLEGDVLGDVLVTNFAEGSEREGRLVARFRITAEEVIGNQARCTVQ